MRLIYRIYRKLKRYTLENPKSLAAWLLFSLIPMVDRLATQRNVRPEKTMENKIWKALYFMRYGSRPPFVLSSADRLAVDSDDHKWPRGSIHDDTVNPRFNRRVYHYFKFRPDLRLMDLGCAGGGMVKSFIEDGHQAVGLEGSDISKKLRSGQWDTIPYHLFTCDIGKPFTVCDQGGAPAKFHCITAWEVLEHLPEDRIPRLLKNIADHLAPDGIFVCSIDETPDGNPLTGAVYHLTLRPKSWWLERFSEQGMEPVGAEGLPFEKEDFLRGTGVGIRDWDPADGDGFHLIMKLRQD